MSVKMRKLKRIRSKRNADLSRRQTAAEIPAYSHINDLMGRGIDIGETLRWQRDDVAVLRRQIDDVKRIKNDFEVLSAIKRGHDGWASLRRIEDDFMALQRANGVYETPFTHSLLQNIDKITTIQQEVENVLSLQRHPSGIDQFQRHLEKSLAFQREIERAIASSNEIDSITKLTGEMKRQAFLEVRAENYAASLRLEGLDVQPDPAMTTLASLRDKYAR